MAINKFIDANLIEIAKQQNYSIEEVEQINNDIQAKLAKANKDCEDAKNALANIPLQTEINKLEEDKGLIAGKIRSLKVDIDQKTDKLENISAQIANFQSQYDLLDGKRSQLEKMNSRLDELKKLSVGDLDARETSLNDNANAISNELDQLRSDYQKINELAPLRAELDISMRNLNEFKEKYQLMYLVIPI